MWDGRERPRRRTQKNTPLASRTASAPSDVDSGLNRWLCAPLPTLRRRADKGRCELPRNLRKDDPRLHLQARLRRSSSSKRQYYLFQFIKGSFTIKWRAQASASSRISCARRPTQGTIGRVPNRCLKRADHATTACSDRGFELLPRVRLSKIVMRVKNRNRT